MNPSLPPSQSSNFQQFLENHGNVPDSEVPDLKMPDLPKAPKAPVPEAPSSVTSQGRKYSIGLESNNDQSQVIQTKAKTFFSKTPNRESSRKRLSSEGSKGESSSKVTRSRSKSAPEVGGIKDKIVNFFNRFRSKSLSNLKADPSSQNVESRESSTKEPIRKASSKNISESKSETLNPTQIKEHLENFAGRRYDLKAIKKEDPALYAAMASWGKKNGQPENFGFTDKLTTLNESAKLPLDRAGREKFLQGFKEIFDDHILQKEQSFDDTTMREEINFRNSPAINSKKPSDDPESMAGHEIAEELKFLRDRIFDKAGNPKENLLGDREFTQVQNDITSLLNVCNDLTKTGAGGNQWVGGFIDEFKKTLPK